jgi:hypothetical protein
MIQRIAKLFNKTLRPGNKPPKAPSLKDLQTIRNALLSCLSDCDGLQAQRLHLKISSAATAQDLWHLRNDAYQVISQQHSQNVAVERINPLIEAFEGWVEARHLVRIR